MSNETISGLTATAAAGGFGTDSTSVTDGSNFGNPMSFADAAPFGTVNEFSVVGAMPPIPEEGGSKRRIVLLVALLLPLVGLGGWFLLAEEPFKPLEDITAAFSGESTDGSEMPPPELVDSGQTPPAADTSANDPFGDLVAEEANNTEPAAPGMATADPAVAPPPAAPGAETPPPPDGFAFEDPAASGDSPAMAGAPVAPPAQDTSVPPTMPSEAEDVFAAGDLSKGVPSAPQEAAVVPPKVVPAPPGTEAPPAPADPAVVQAPAQPAGESIAVPGPESETKAWEALDDIAEWRETGSYDPDILPQYLAHKKVWVRLASLWLAYDLDIYPIENLRIVATEIRSAFDHGRIRRFLTRVKVEDTNTWLALKELLGV